ncbi:hypothetical protein ACWGIU_31880, partial [Streptomyces sp. NPDC054840]
MKPALTRSRRRTLGPLAAVALAGLLLAGCGGQNAAKPPAPAGQNLQGGAPAAADAAPTGKAPAAGSQSGGSTGTDTGAGA